MIDIMGIKKLNQVKPAAQRTASLGLNEVQGFAKFYIGVNVCADEMKDWPAHKITSFFSGVAQVIHARGNPTK